MVYLEVKEMVDLKPVEAVDCPRLKHIVSLQTCGTCKHQEEIRRPYYRFSVRCNYEA